jgi:hypothetical protein
MTKKYDDFIADLQLLLDRHNLAFNADYEDTIVVNKADKKHLDVDDFFIDGTKD